MDGSLGMSDIKTRWRNRAAPVPQEPTSANPQNTEFCQSGPVSRQPSRRTKMSHWQL